MTQVLHGNQASGTLRCGLPMQRRQSVLRQGFRAGLLGTALWLIAPADAQSQTYCEGITPQNSYACANLQVITYGGNGSDVNNGGESVAAVLPSQLNTARVDIDNNNVEYPTYGIEVGSVGGNGGYPTGGGNGGNGGFAPAALVELALGASVIVVQSGDAPPPVGYGFITGGGVLATVQGGNGGNGWGGDSYSGGFGGDVGGAQISVTDADVGTAGNSLPGLVILAQGGWGGSGGCQVGSNPPGSGCTPANSYSYSNGGNGGNVTGYDYSTGAITNTIAVTAATVPVAITTKGTASSAINAYLVGGAGGNAGPDNGYVGGDDAGNGGAGGSVTAELNILLTGTPQNPINLQTMSNTSPGISATSLGNGGGQGGYYNANSGVNNAGNGGAGGSGGGITIDLTATTINTQGATSPGIIAVSGGAAGGQGGVVYSGLDSDGGSGGAGGSAGNVTIALDSASEINTQGIDSTGILAQSFSGAGGSAGGSGGIIVVTGGNGGSGGDAGTVTVTNDGAITTAGATARGIIAQSIPGAGGSGGYAQGAFYGGAGTGASSGTAAAVTVQHNGSITTIGSNAQGILAQSIGGAGGAGGQASGVFAALGGTASTNPFDSDGGAVTVNTGSGSITTSGTSAMGILGQSIGGGGGDGGGAFGVVASIGGAGGVGGDGGTVSSLLDGTIITTNGDGAHALLLQSIGGGGGNGGNASSDGAFVSVAIGGGCDDDGNCDGGGNGGSTTASLDDAAIITVGSKSAGVLVQSIGGGGGTGGNAFAGSIGAGFSLSEATGGSGGSGGKGELAQVQISGGTIATGQNPLLTGQSGSSVDDCTALPCNTLPVDSYGVVVQSIGGGGGLGGSAAAQSIAVTFPVAPEVQVAVAVSGAVGGTGGSGGDGGTAQFALTDGGQIITSGQGSTAVLVQSIGGGGGAGGDSSAMALTAGPFNPGIPESPSAVSVGVTIAAGGNGSAGGDGGAVDVTLGDDTLDSYSNPTSITTYGDFANGVTAQSIGGGGGNAGFGSSNSQGFSTDYNLSVQTTLGSQGGTGGEGGDVTAYLYAGNGITTYGSGAVGLVAQSIGGGGGTSQGGSYGIGASFSADNTNFSTSATVNVGSDGGVGGAGGDVTVSAQAPITTRGGDATGVLAQSIGGGGGLGGSAGADASADNPVVQGLDARQATSNWGSFFASQDDDEDPQNGSYAANLTASVGGEGGAAGDGGTVWTALYAPVTTTGDWAKGIVAQSIGGGGGMGGTAVASGTGGYSYVTVNADVAIGGQGGNSGDGGSVTVELDQGDQGGSYDNNTSISTAGFGAAGVIAQSVGGGGGIGADGSDSATGTLSVGTTTGGSGGGGGDGGAVLVSYYNPGTTVVATKGDAADGVILQSIGGGGGMAGAGSGRFAPAFQQSGNLKLTAGGGPAASGDGGAVTFAPSSDSDTPITITTAGDDSFGILAQSIGGGGGLATSQQSSTTSPNLTIGGSGGQSNDGGAVSVTLGSQGTVATMGIGAHGIVAQSIGGGGGVVRLVNFGGDSPTLDTSVPSSLSNAPAVGDGGTVDVEVDGTVAVTGPGAVGILAQSVGSGGGLVMSGNTFYAGSSNFNNEGSSGYGGVVTVAANGNVSATGENGIGIFAQSTGYSNGTNREVNVTVGGSVTGGGGQAAMSDSSGNSTQTGSSAIQVDSPNGSNNGVGNVVTVNSGASLNTMSGTSGTAIVQTGGGTTNVTNAGTVTGSTYLGKGGTFTNAVGGVHNSGSDVQGHVVNHSAMNIGLPNEVRATRITGDFTQTSTGQLGLTINSLLNTVDYLQVDGSASIDGIIVPTAITLLPGTVRVVTGKTLVSTADAVDSLLFSWDTAQSGNTLSITPHSIFTPGGVALNDSQSSLAGYFGRAWNNVDKTFATRFADLSRIKDGSHYKAALDAWSGKATHAQSIALVNSAGTILGAAMSCPVFVVDSVVLGEDDCVWSRLTRRWTEQSSNSDTQGYDVSGTTYRIGVQDEIAPDWYLGASFGFGQSRATMDGGSSGDGETYDGSVSLKRVMGPWQFAGSVALAGGSFHTDRRIDIPGIASETPTSDPSAFLAGGRLRAAYEFAFDDWYIRPYGDLDVVYSNLPGFGEQGGLYALDVRGSSKTSVTLSPMVEFGGRVDLDAQSTLRAYAAFGLSYQPDNTRTIDSSFVGASSADGTFSDQIDSPEVLGRIDVGVQLLRAGGYELKGEYTADIGDSFLSQSASARLAYHF